MEDVVHTVHGVLHGLDVPDVSNEEFDFIRRFRQLGLKFVAHIVLLFLVPGKNADFSDVRVQEAVQHRIAKGTGAAGNHQGFIGKNAHSLLS